MVVTSPRRRFGPVKACIYCGATRYSKDREKLGKEHVIPEGLGGNFEILEASCFDCEKKINKAESAFQNVAFDLIRHRLKLTSKKRPAHKRKTTAAVTFTYSGKDEIRHVPFDDLPIAIMGAVWLPPGIWSGREEGGGTNTLRGYPVPTHLLDILLDKYGAEKVLLPELRAGGPEFFPSLAKIAHSFCVAHYGLNGFYPFLIDIILQRPSDFPSNYFIGGLRPDDKPPEKDIKVLHMLRIQEYPFAGFTYLVAFVGLFHYYGFPIHQVVVGVLKCSSKSPLLELK